MSRSIQRSLVLVALLGVGAVPAAAQQAKLPPIRSLGPITARSSEPMGAVSTAVPLPGGKVLINDILQRRVIMFDSTLTSVTVIADSTSATANAYGARGGGLLSFEGDSALFIDPASLSMMVVNAHGELAGVRAVPRAAEINLLVGGPNGRPGFDAQGRMVYRGQARGRPAGANARPTVGNFVMPQQPDSAPVVRVDLATRKIDTIAMIKIPRTDIKVTQGNDGSRSIQATMNPLPTTDDWALLSDGSIAVVRGHDFHVDWISADGKVTSSPKILFEWQRLTDEEKEMVLDSARAAIELQRAEAERVVGRGGFGGGMGGLQIGGMGGGMGGGPGGGGGGDRGGRGGGAGGAPPQRGGGADGGTPPQRGGAAGPGGGGFRVPTVSMVSASELPDYRPPFGQQSALGDLDGNLWVRTTAPVGDGGSIYYVINRQNEVVDRIQLPQGRILAGFGQGGVIYLGMRDTEGNARLESAYWK
jgi:hypothetical protein